MRFRTENAAGRQPQFVHSGARPTRYRLRALLIVLLTLWPSLAWGRSERHDYRERARLRREVHRAAQAIDKRARLWQGFQLDVF